MSYSPPLDQRIVDEYFHLSSNKKTKKIAWLYGMIATYGLKPDELNDFIWNADFSINVLGKKRSVFPLHPQWVFLFNLKEKQPRDMQSCVASLSSLLYEAIAYQSVQLNITDLVLAHKIRKNHYKQVKQPIASSLALAAAS